MLHCTHARSVPGAAVPAKGCPPCQEKAVLLSVRCCRKGCKPAASSLPHPPLVFPGGRGGTMAGKAPGRENLGDRDHVRITLEQLLASCEPGKWM